MSNAVDAIASALSPDYLVLLDGPDVIPHIVLDNPVPNDLDDTVDSDLPYASNVSHTKQAARYLKITRVVGRIPNVPGATSPDRVIRFIETAVKAKSAPKSTYQGYFGLTADVWRDSTAMSLDAAFGSHTALDVAPPAAPPSTDGRFSKLSHFINCHGSPLKPEFYGQKGTNYPISMTSTQVAGKGVAGTVITAECEPNFTILPWRRLRTRSASPISPQERSAFSAAQISLMVPRRGTARPTY
jgi:hypothetical protein